MAPHRTSRLGSICAVLALVVSGGSVGVRPHGMHEHGMECEDATPAAFAAATPSAPVMMNHGPGPHRGHPMGGGPTCPCAGACLDGSPVIQAAVTPPMLQSPPEFQEAASPEPTLPVLRDPTAYLRPLPNAPPLA